jgi:hypothetical protein
MWILFYLEVGLISLICEKGWPSTAGHTSASTIGIGSMLYQDQRASFIRMPWETMPCLPCKYCSAKHWIVEKVNGPTLQSPTFSSCCAAGQVVLPALSIAQSHSCIIQIRTLNIFLASIMLHWPSPHWGLMNYGANVPPAPHATYVLKVHGEFHHLHGPLTTVDETQPQSSACKTNYWKMDEWSTNQNLNPSLLLDLDTMVWEHNTHVNKYKAAD